MSRFFLLKTCVLFSKDHISSPLYREFQYYLTYSKYIHSSHRLYLLAGWHQVPVSYSTFGHYILRICPALSPAWQQGARMQMASGGGGG